MAENISELLKDMNPQIQDTQILSRIKKKQKSITRHITVKLQNITGKADREIMQITTMT